MRNFFLFLYAILLVVSLLWTFSFFWDNPKIQWSYTYMAGSAILYMIFMATVCMAQARLEYFSVLLALQTFFVTLLLYGALISVMTSLPQQAEFLAVAHMVLAVLCIIRNAYKVAFAEVTSPHNG